MCSSQQSYSIDTSVISLQWPQEYIENNAEICNAKNTILNNKMNKEHATR